MCSNQASALLHRRWSHEFYEEVGWYPFVEPHPLVSQKAIIETSDKLCGSVISSFLYAACISHYQGSLLILFCCMLLSYVIFFSGYAQGILLAVVHNEQKQ